MSKSTVSINNENSSLKDLSLLAIQDILVSQYNVPRNIIPVLFHRSNIDQIFERDAELAAHTSYKTWAQRAFEHIEASDYGPSIKVHISDDGSILTSEMVECVPVSRA